MTGYTRQSAANMTTGAVIYASDLNNELNALQSAFDGSTGHAHDGSTGNGPKINLTTSVTGILPAANGGIGGLNKLDATTAPGVTDDANDGYVVGSFWVDITNDIIYFALDVTPGAAVWSRYQPYDIELTALAGLTSAADKLPYFTGSGTAALTTFTSYGRSLVDDADAPAARSTLGLGTISTQAANSVNITGGSISGITDLAVADGGTGASDSSGARTNLGLVIGTDVQAYNAALSSIAGLSTSSNQMIYTTGSNAYATTALTSFARSILDDSDAASVRSTLGLVIGTDVQAYDTELAAIAGLTSAADRLPYFTGSGTAALATFTSAGRALVDDVDAQAQRTTLAAAGLADDNTFSGINTFTKTQKWAKGVAVASAATLTLGDDGNYFDVTGTTAIISIATVGVGTVVKLHFDGALTLTHHSTDLVLPGGANITTAAGDEAEFVEYDTGKWRCTNYQRSNVYPAAVRFSANKNGTNQTGLGTTPTKLTFTTETEDVGGYYDAANSRFTPLVSGTYQVSCILSVAGTLAVGALCKVQIYKNGSLFFQGLQRSATTTSVFPSIIKQVPMNGSTDYIEIYYEHYAAGGTVVGSATETVFEAYLI